MITPVRLTCEYRENPVGLDVAGPRLGWILQAASSQRRSLRQKAYQILVASAPEMLSEGRGDLWDSGQVLSAATNGIAYDGEPLVSRQECWWSVRVRDQDDHVSAWSQPAKWTMGLLEASDWHAVWITDRILADPENRPRTPIHCYRSEISSRPDDFKWITIDLGSPRKMDGIRLRPARPEGITGDYRTEFYPLRFRVDAALSADFSDAERLVDETDRDQIAPKPPLVPLRSHRFDPVEARYVRLTVTRLARWEEGEYALGLGMFEILDGERNIATGTGVTCPDSVEDDRYSKRYLTSDKVHAGYAPVPPVLMVDVPGVPRERTVSRVPLLRRDFSLDGTVLHATLSATARGFYEIRINGSRVGDELLAPGFTEYGKRLQVQTHDVTALMKTGANAIGAALGYGWHASHLNLYENRYCYGHFPQLLAQLDIEFTDGRTVSIASDADWHTTLSGPALFSDVLDGETYDARLELPGWDQAGFDDSSWSPCTTLPRDDARLIWQRTQPVRRISELKAVRVTEPGPGVRVYDFGEEIAGWCRLRVDGPAGMQITLRHAETLQSGGTIDTQSLWGIFQREDYILDGKGIRDFEPHFTYHGFRYVEVSGLNEGVRLEALTAIELHTDAPVAGTFECSNGLFNRLMSTASRTMDNLLFDIPAGCAARGERLGWLGDIRPCVHSLLFHRDAAAFLEKYATDMRDSQLADGRFSDITPRTHVLHTEVAAGAPGWGDAGVTLPWDTYLHTGDTRILADHFDAACHWVECILSHNPGLLWSKMPGPSPNWGDWCNGCGPAMPKDVGATAFLARDAWILSRMAQALGRTREAEHYQALLLRIKAAFNEAFVSSGGEIKGDAQGCYAMALLYDLLDEPVKSKAVTRFVETLRKTGGHPTTGFWSSNALVDALSLCGRHDIAAETASLTDRPSWGFMATAGTTYWENWGNSLKDTLPDGSVMPPDPWTYAKDVAPWTPEPFPGIESLNHWTYSAIAEWLWCQIAGLNPDPEHPGFSSFIVRPRLCRQVDHCNAVYASIRGPIEIRWRREADRFTLSLVVPPNTTATLHLPASSADTVTESAKSLHEAEGIAFLGTEDDAILVSLTSGHYHFASSLPDTV